MHSNRRVVRKQMYMWYERKINEVLVCDNDEFVKIASIGTHTHLAVVCFHSSFGGLHMFYQSRKTRELCDVTWEQYGKNVSLTHGSTMGKHIKKNMWTKSRRKLDPCLFDLHSLEVAAFGELSVNGCLVFFFRDVFFFFKKCAKHEIQYNLKSVCRENGQKHSIEDCNERVRMNEWKKQQPNKSQCKVDIFSLFCMDFAT